MWDAAGATNGRPTYGRSKITNMTTEIRATYRLVTPMFCAGAAPEQAELRLPSFKGVLRFWWRALSWSRLRADLTKIQEEEAELFGSSSGGQSRVSLRLETATCPVVVANDTVLRISAEDRRTVGDGARYLGYGVMEAFARRGTQSGQLTRSCLRAPLDFTVRARGRHLTEELVETLLDALIAVGVVGGMGARSRRGYGSLNLRALSVDAAERWTEPRSRHDLRDRVRMLRCDSDPSRLPEFTAFSSDTRHVLVQGGRSNLAPMELLDLVGRELMRYRSWGHRGQVLGRDSEKNFVDDHDLMKGSRRVAHPRRIAFGLPHNYGKRKEQQVGPYGQLDRRASPLFVHVHECRNTSVAVLSFFPSRFLPNNTAISVGGTRVLQKPEAELYRPVHDFLDRLLDPGRRKELMTAEEVQS